MVCQRKYKAGSVLPVSCKNFTNLNWTEIAFLSNTLLQLSLWLTTFFFLSNSESMVNLVACNYFKWVEIVVVAEEILKKK